MTAPERAPLGAALALLLALVSLTGPASPTLMAGAVALLTLLVALAWPDLLELPSPVGTRAVLAGVGVAGAVLAASSTDRFSPISGIVMVCAVGVFAAFAHQMLRSDRRDLTASLTGTIAGVFVAGISATWVLAQTEAISSGRSGLVAAVAAGLAATLLLNATPLPPTLRSIVSALAGIGVTALLATSLAGLGLLIAAGLGLLITIGAGCAQLLVGSSLVAREPVPSLAVGAVPVATAGVLAHLAVLLLP
ncbi:hypothetical protein BH708_09435 [Brachybacterium sp. P6-10-X1]|uniref:hypothetical protein n=1 Tax=Brachybacterium sp. P6-10-X1 TaxID=1903186 RepID=UPI0009717C50|nr:hypothetical protein [Brachybacterium sp. P6-10-X1]APX32901.1 hypothetical protein BH708_09435 [Brachybacterium sp. P6-10-X1]